MLHCIGVELVEQNAYFFQGWIVFAAVIDHILQIIQPQVAEGNVGYVFADGVCRPIAFDVGFGGGGEFLLRPASIDVGKGKF